jgi:flagellar L-ring protein precursor FlgH
MMRKSVLFAFSGLAVTLGACGTIKDTVSGPRLTDLGTPALAASMQSSPGVIASASPSPVIPPAAVPGATANSLWRPGARAFFIDQRASKPGDIVTVLITIDDSAKLSNTTTSSRQNATKGQISHALGLEGALAKMLPDGFDPANAIDQSGNTNSTGAGTMDRQEKISLTVAAIVTGVLPNGNLVIQGRQEVRANSELRELTVAGMIRPEDISSANTIRHTQIAEARISYGGRGDLTRVQRTPVGQALMEQFSPF